MGQQWDVAEMLVPLFAPEFNMNSQIVTSESNLHKIKMSVAMPLPDCAFKYSSTLNLQG